MQVDIPDIERRDRIIGLRVISDLSAFQCLHWVRILTQQTFAVVQVISPRECCITRYTFLWLNFREEDGFSVTAEIASSVVTNMENTPSLYVALDSVGESGLQRSRVEEAISRTGYVAEILKRVDSP